MIRALMALSALAAASGAVETGAVNARDGVRIVYDVRGQGDTTLLFVHCWSCDRTFWREQADAFVGRYRVVTLDMAGHGESGRDRKSWTIAGLGADVAVVAGKLKLKRIVLVGHSMGGAVALEAARLLKGRVLGVIAVDTLHNAEMRVTPAMIQPIADKLKADFPATVASFMGSMFPKDGDPAVRQFVEKKAMAADPAIAVALMLDLPNLDLKKMFTDAGVPIRAINAKPPAAPATAFETNRKYADYDAVVMEGVGHFLQLERPKEFNEHLAAFAAALSGSR